ncbi:hypothetical protein ACWC10_05910 [Streptomyces sp. NPDC001595]|uniref:hypothetical protein n=1 Tax=Streptomyces sp. NPDC001532 TaxID=3154520 RepID=UPI00332A0857
MRRPTGKRDLLRRIEEVEARLDEPTPAPLDGQEAIDVGTIAHHTYEGPGPCRADLFGTLCGAHRDEHKLVAD